MKWVAAMFDIYTEILVIYLAFISSDPILQYIISMHPVRAIATVARALASARSNDKYIG